MKITFIHTPFLYMDKENRRHSHCLGLRSIISYLKYHGFRDIEYIDALQEGFDTVTPFTAGYLRGLTIDQILDRVSPDTDMVGISVPFSQLALVARGIIAGLKQRFPGVTVVMGGVYPSTSPERALTSEADLIVVGEGEKAFLQLVQGISPRDIPGVYSPVASSGGAATRRQQTQFIDILDSLPFPDYQLPGLAAYFP